MAKIVEITSNINNSTDTGNLEANKEEEINFETQVHFTPQEGFFLKDKEGKHIYPLGGILQNFVMQLISMFLKKS